VVVDNVVVFVVDDVDVVVDVVVDIAVILGDGCC